MHRFTLTAAEREVYRRYANLALPRHTSYPIAPVWTAAYGHQEYRVDLGHAAAKRLPLSLYVHVPFCEKLCYYCACTKEILPRSRQGEHGPVQDFLEGLKIEADALSAILEHNAVHQVHLGGGSPTYLSAPQLETLWRTLMAGFQLAPGAEVAIEVDPRITTFEQLDILRRLGFNRISLGVQDFNEKVQRTVNRIQPLEQVAQTVRWSRQLGFTSVNFDLIYGLPFQTVESMADTLQKTISLAPDRIAFFRLAVIPEIFRWQNTFRQADLPGGELSLDLNLLAINTFLDAGYAFVGLDHFAKPDEALSRADRDQSLRRNFQGMTTGKRLEIIGLGPSAISQLRAAFAQNHKTTADWRVALAADLPIARGLSLSADDRLRQELMQQLYGHGRIDKRALEREFAIDFEAYFADQVEALVNLERDGLVRCSSECVEVTPVLGRLLVRVVAAVFDCYLPRDAYREGLPAALASKVG